MTEEKVELELDANTYEYLRKVAELSNHSIEDVINLLLAMEILRNESNSV